MPTRNASDYSGEQVSPNDPAFPFVSIDPDRCGGEPVFRGTRVPIRTLFDYIKAGEPIEEFLTDFDGVSREQINGVIDLARTGLIDRLRAA